MLKEPGCVYLNKEEQRELLDRSRRTETRLIKMMESLGLNKQGDVITTLPKGARDESNT